MRRKSNRNVAKATPEPKKATRSSSRSKNSRTQELEDESKAKTYATKNETISDPIEEQLQNIVFKESLADHEATVTKEFENQNNDTSDINESHTPPHLGSSGNQAPNNDEVDAEKGKSKGLNNSQVEENSEIKMNSVTSVSGEGAIANCDVNPEVHVSDNMNSCVNLEAQNKNTEKNEDHIIAEAGLDQHSSQDESVELSEQKCNLNSEAQHSEIFEVTESETQIETNDTIVNVNDATQLAQEDTKNEDVDDDPAEEGEIRESKSDEENENIAAQGVKVKKPPVKIKLRRDSFFESLSQSENTELETKKFKWNPTEHQCLKLSYDDLFQLNIGDFKALSSDLKLADEKEIRLEEIYQPKLGEAKSIKERVKSMDASSEDLEKPEYTKQSSTMSSDDQDSTNIIALNRKISIVDDTASKLRPPPSPAKQPASPILFISNLVRPFTIKQLKELLQRTGTIKEDGFWTDRIKSKCYVQYESTEEAEDTRNALHGVNWPVGNGKKLIIEFATEEEMEKAQNPPPQPVAPVIHKTPPRPKTPLQEIVEPVYHDHRNGDDREDRKRKDSERERERDRGRTRTTREWDVGKDSHKRGRSRSREKKRKHSGRRSITPLEDFIARKQRKLEESVPQKLMDDLFQRTKAMPCIYWQPLSPEEISIKQQQRLSRMEEHKRRLEENSRNRGGGVRDPGRGAFRRRFD